MDAATFADLPIIAGVGRGPAVVGATFAELEAAFGKPDRFEQHAGSRYPGWYELGVQACIDPTARVVGLRFYFADRENPKFANVAARTERGVEFGVAPDAVVEAHGPPLTSTKSSIAGEPWQRLKYDGIGFRFSHDRLVEITIERSRQRAPTARPRNPELEVAIVANPEDEQAYLVYADWLQQQGEPFGELVVRAAQDPSIESELLGPLADVRDMLSNLEWRAGFIRRVKVANTFDRSPVHDGKQSPILVEDVLAMLLDEPCGRFVEDLTLGIVTYQENSYDGCMTVIGLRQLPALRTLYVGSFDSEETELNWSELGDASVMYPALPNLRSLTLRSGTMHLGTVDLPELRELVTLTGGLQRDAIESIATARWPKLERLSLQLGSGRYGSNIQAEHLQPILDGEGLPPTLYHLGLANFEYANELVPLLAASKIVPRIRSLDLSQGTLNNEGAEELIAQADAFRHLEMIDLSESWFDPATTRRVAEALPNAVLAGQRFDARWPDDFYIAAGE